MKTNIIELIKRLEEVKETIYRLEGYLKFSEKEIIRLNDENRKLEEEKRENEI